MPLPPPYIDAPPALVMAAAPTLAEGEVLRQALLAGLAAATFPEAPELRARLTNATAFIDPAGTLRIGEWLAEPRGNALVLTTRLPAPPDAPGFTGYAARFTRKGGGWMLEGIADFHVGRRR